MSYDFSLSNPNIRAWFNQETDVVPVREFVYTHEHPLIRPNFVSQIEVLIYETGQHMLARDVKGAPVNRLVSLTETFIKNLDSFTQDRTEELAQDVLGSLRSIYLLCLKIKKL